MTFFIFLLLAASVWFVNELSLDYTSNFYYQINTHNSSDRNAPQFTSAEPVEIKARAQGFLILYNHLYTPIVNLDTKDYHVQTLSNNEGHYMLITSSLRNDIVRSIDANITIEAFGSDTLRLKPVEE